MTLVHNAHCVPITQDWYAIPTLTTITTNDPVTAYHRRTTTIQAKQGTHDSANTGEIRKVLDYVLLEPFIQQYVMQCSLGSKYNYEKFDTIDW